MKRVKRTFITTELLLGLLVLVSIGVVVYNKAADKTERIAVIVPGIDESQWSAFKYGLKMAAQEYDAALVIINKENMDTIDGEVETAAKELEKGIDAMILYPIGQSEDEQGIQSLAEKVPMILAGDTLASKKTEKIPVVEPDQYQMGADLVGRLLENYNGNLNGKTIGIYAKSSDTEAAVKREAGVRDSLEESNAEILWSVAKDSDPDEIVNLQTQRKVDIVIALDNESLVEAGERARQNDLSGALVYGIGNSTEAIYYLDSGWVECVVMPNEFEEGYQSVKELVSKLRERGYTIKNHKTAYTLLTRENLFLKENQSLLSTISQ